MIIEKIYEIYQNMAIEKIIMHATFFSLVNKNTLNKILYLNFVIY